MKIFMGISVLVTMWYFYANKDKREKWIAIVVGGIIGVIYAFTVPDDAYMLWFSLLAIIFGAASYFLFSNSEES